jgi:HD-GYP domain-containing protein (c-di-GMP phosphodiesterase class II)
MPAVELKNELETLDKHEATVLPLDQIRANSITDFKIFVNNGNDYRIYKPSGYQWQSHDLENLTKTGHGAVYYHVNDTAKVQVYLKFASLPTLDASLKPEQRVVKITDIAAEMTKMLYNEPLTEAAIIKGKEIASQMVTCIEEDRTCVAALGKLANHHWYTYYHSARVASYALALAMEMGQTDKIQLQAMAAGCIFHDIGKSKIDLTILNKNGPLTNDEWTLIKKHPEFGEQLVHDGFLGVVPLEIILHHHERLDGGGYPHKLTAKDILMEVRIASFADTFDALTTNRTYQAGRSRYEALDLIRHRFLEQLDKDCYKAMVLILKRASEKA